MKTTHHEIEIAYDESDDLWHFDLRGRKRSAPTLSKAREAIDKEPAEKRKQVFSRFGAYLFKYPCGYEIVTITGLAEEALGRLLKFWVADKAGNRSKEYANSLFPVNDKNTAIVANIANLQKQIDDLEEKKNKQHERLQAAVVPTELT